MTAFSDRLDEFFRELFVIDPLRATAAGLHDHDGAWPDFSSEGRFSRLAFYDEWARRLAGFGDDEAGLDEQVDRDLVLMELEAARFGDTTLREESWSPLAWVYILGDGIFPLLAREFAPVGDRLASVTARLEGMPTVLVHATRELVGHHGRPVSRLHTETALRQIAGIHDLIGDAVNQADAVPTDAAVVELRPRLEAAAESAREALRSFETHLREVVLPASQGEGRLGAALFAEKLRHTLKSDMTPADVLARARREFDAVRAEMIRLAYELWPAWLPDRPIPAADEANRAVVDQEVVRGVLDAIGTDHQKADDILDFCRAEVGRIEAFARGRDLIGLADEPLEIRWTPVFMRSFGGAMLDSPGPLDRGQKAFFSVTPIPDDWTPGQAESYLREDNDRMLRLLTIHEAVPGHYLQGVYANRCPSIARTILWSGVFAEGWAVYVTQVMMDLGYGADDPALLLVHWKFYIRAVINALIDEGIHAGSMTEDEAVGLMIEGGFQEESEARSKWNRARLTSTQLSTYFVGSVEMWDLELDQRQRAAASAAGGGPTATIAPPRVVGNLGITPGFEYRTHLERVISHGAPPMVLLRRLLES